VLHLMHVMHVMHMACLTSSSGHGHGSCCLLPQRRAVRHPLPPPPLQPLYKPFFRFVTLSRSYHTSWAEDEGNGQHNLYIVMELCKYGRGICVRVRSGVFVTVLRDMLF
jgi:hypothetical protein